MNTRSKMSGVLLLLVFFITNQLFAQNIQSVSQSSVSAGSGLSVTVIGNGTTFNGVNDVFLSQSTSSTIGVRKMTNVNILSDTELNFQAPCDVPPGVYYVLTDTTGAAGSALGLPWPNPIDWPLTITAPEPGAGCNVIKGHIFQDKNGNCVQDVGETGLAGYGLTVTSTTPGFGTQIFETDSLGYYETSVGVGDFTIAAAYDSSGKSCPLIFTYSCPTNAGHSYDHNFGGVDEEAVYNFGLKPYCSAITGVVFQDNNGNCTQDANEPVQSGARIDIISLSDSTRTFAYSHYDGQFFKYLKGAIGDYEVKIYNPSKLYCNYYSYTPTCPANPENSYQITISEAGQAQIVNFGVAKNECNQLTAQFFNDANGNCAIDASEENINNGYVVIWPANNPTQKTIRYANNQGWIQASLPDGEYVVKAYLNGNHYYYWGQEEYCVSNGHYSFSCLPSSDTTFTVVFDQAGVHETDTVRFAMAEGLGSDLRVYSFANGARPGFNNHYIYSYIYNAGAKTSEPATVTVNFDSDLALLNSMTWGLGANNYYQYLPITPVSQSAGQAVYDVPALAPGRYYYIYSQMQVPLLPVVQMGELLPYKATLSVTPSDSCLANNSDSGWAVVTNAVDPNDKTLLSPAVKHDTLITPDLADKWTYLIRFQNTGTDTCFTVVVRDTLADGFDAASLVTEIASHDYTVEIENDKYVIWTFSNILLPDSNTNEPLSHGFIRYSVAPKANTPLGTNFDNNADIYFDYNEPVITNTTVHVLDTLPVVPLALDQTDQTVCAGTVVVVTATGADSYVWNPTTNVVDLGANQYEITVTANITYTVTGSKTDYTDGVKTLAFTVSVPTATISASETTLCAGQSATLSVAEGFASYDWSPTTGLSATDVFSVTATPTVSTDYTVTVTDAFGCTATATVSLTVNPLPTVSVSSASATVCVNQSIGLTALGATDYVWEPGALSGDVVSVSPLVTTIYTVTGYENGCSATATIEIEVLPLPTATADVSIDVICEGGQTTLSATGGVIYNWEPGGLSGDIVDVSPTETTTYTVTVSDNLCEATATVTVTVKPLPVLQAVAAVPAICSGESATISASGADTYLWLPGGETTATLLVSPNQTQTYTVRGTTNGCDKTAEVTLLVYAIPNVTIDALLGAGCPNETVTLTASGAANYAWQPGDLSGTTISVNPSVTTVYTVTGEQNGCSSTATFEVFVQAPLNIEASASELSLCEGASTTLTGAGGATYAWQPGNLTGASVTVSPSVTTTYTLSGSDGVCSATAVVTIEVKPLPTVSATASANEVCPEALVELTGAGADFYAWEPGGLSGQTVQVNPVQTTTYTVTGVLNGCEQTNVVTVLVRETPTIAASASLNNICPTDAVTLTATGGTTYTWEPGGLSGDVVFVNPAATTTYTVTGSDGFCIATATLTVDVLPIGPMQIVSTANEICLGKKATLFAGGATSYSWEPGGSTGSKLEVWPEATTTYTLTGYKNGCTATTTFTLTVNTPPTVEAAADQSLICQGGFVTLAATGANDYLWQPGGLSGEQLTLAPQQTTTYTVTGMQGVCTATATVTVVVEALPVVTATASESAVCPGGSATLTATGGVSYLWKPGNLDGESITVSPEAGLTYTVTATSETGCTATATVFVGVRKPEIILSAAKLSVCPGGSGVVTVSGADNLQWTPAVQSLGNGQYRLSATEAAIFTVKGQSCGVEVEAKVSFNILNQPEPQIVNLGKTLKTGGYATYQWKLNGQNLPNATQQTYQPDASGEYTVTVTDANGCTGQSAPVPFVWTSRDEAAAFQSSLTLFPNPTAQRFTVRFETVADFTQLKVVDMTGKTVYDWEEKTAVGVVYEKSIDLTNLPAGVYRVQIQNGTVRALRSVVLER